MARVFAILLAGLVAASLPVMGALTRSALVLPFTGCSVWCSLERAIRRGEAVVLKSYLSALAVLVVVSTTPLPDLLHALESFGTPRFLLMVAQFIYRYLFVISEEAQHMSKAAVSRRRHARGAWPETVRVFELPQAHWRCCLRGRTGARKRFTGPCWRAVFPGAFVASPPGISRRATLLFWRLAGAYCR